MNLNEKKARSNLDLSDTDQSSASRSDVEKDIETTAQITALEQTYAVSVRTPSPAATPTRGISPEPATGPVPDVPPDGGLQAWLQVVGASVILVDTWGIVNSFGVFQAYYEEYTLPNSSPSDISWIGSTQAALLLLVGVIAGPLFDAGHFQTLLRVGLFMVIFGMFMTSICTAYWQFLLAQGFCVGIGMGLLFLPCTAILSQYFARRRALVIGVSSAGSPIAGIVFPIIFTNLVERIGFGWATRIIAFILLGLSIVPLIFLRPRLPPRGRRAEFDPSAIRDVSYMTFNLAGFFAFLTLYVPFFYITLFATSHRISSVTFAPYLVTMLNAGSVFGRIIPNALADKFGSLNVLVVCMLGSTAVGFGWLGIKNTAGAAAFALLYGALSGGVVSLTPTVIVSLSPDMGRVGARMGMGFMVTGLALLVGTPIAGAIVNGYTEARWHGMIAYGATGLLVSTAFYALSRLMVYRERPGWKF